MFVPIKLYKTNPKKKGKRRFEYISRGFIDSQSVSLLVTHMVDEDFWELATTDGNFYTTDKEGAANLCVAFGVVGVAERPPSYIG